MVLVLVIDDDPINAVLAEAILCRAGYDVVVASQGTIGLKLARDRLPDLIMR